MKVTSVNGITLIEDGRVAVWAADGVPVCGVVGGDYFVTTEWSHVKGVVEHVWGWSPSQIRKMIEQGKMRVVRTADLRLDVNF